MHSLRDQPQVASDGWRSGGRFTCDRSGTGAHPSQKHDVPEAKAKTKKPAKAKAGNVPAEKPAKAAKPAVKKVDVVEPEVKAPEPATPKKSEPANKAAAAAAEKKPAAKKAPVKKAPVKKAPAKQVVAPKATPARDALQALALKRTINQALTPLQNDQSAVESYMSKMICSSSAQATPGRSGAASKLRGWYSS